MQEIIRRLPNEKMVYFADTARIPYGEKSSETILRYSIENSAFLLEHEIKLLVVACNTASAHALEHLKQSLPVPVVGVIEAGAKKAVSITRNKRIAVLGTRGTIQSGIYEKEIHNLLPDALVRAIPCPLLVPMIEEKMMEHPATKLIVKEYLSPLKEMDIDTLLLGCTHYPLLRRVFQEEMGEEVAIVDSASTCAEAVASALNFHRLSNTQKGALDYRYFVSDDPHKFKSLSKGFLSLPIENVSSISEPN